MFYDGLQKYDSRQQIIASLLPQLSRTRSGVGGPEKTLPMSAADNTLLGNGLRKPSEANYVRALWAYTAQNPAVGEVTVCRQYLMESKPFLPLPWPPSG
jgi:hypothetical protein